MANDSRIKLIAGTIHENSFEDPVNTVKVWHDALRHIQIQARDTSTNREVLDFIADKFQRAQAAGYAEQDMAAMIKIFGSSSSD